MSGTARNGRGFFAFRPDPPLDFDLTLQRYRLWGVDPANVYASRAFFRVARTGDRHLPFRLTVAGPPSRPTVTVSFPGPDTPETRATLRAEARQVLGLDVDLPGFYTRAADDPVLGPLVGPLFGLRPSITPDPFEMLVGAIAAQQVNLPFAYATRARLVQRFGTSFVLDGVTVYAFPSPAAVAAADVDTLRGMQFSTRKSEYLIGLARAIAEGALDLAALARASDEDAVARLTAIRGLGRWTAEWFLARGLGRPDVCPAEDLGVRRAVEWLCFRGRPCDASRIRRRALAWRPYRSVAVHYLLAGRRMARAVAS